MKLNQKIKLKTPAVILIVGVPASGKTSLATALVRKLDQGSYLSKDLIQTEFTDTERLTGETYAIIQEPTFRILVRFAEQQLKLGKIPVIDAPFSINHKREDACKDWISPFRDVADAADARLAIVRCVPPSLETLKDRMTTRGYVWDQWKLENWDIFLEQEPMDFPIDHSDVLEVITNLSVDDLVKTEIYHYLKAV